VTLGSVPNSIGNAYNVGGAGLVSVVSNGQVTVGGSGAGGNWLTITNATMLAGGSPTIGSGSSNNVANVLANGTLVLVPGGATKLIVGDALATGNVLTVNGGVVSGSTVSVLIGNANGSSGNSLIVTNGGQLFSGNITVGNAGGAYSNSFIINGGVASNGALIVGGGGSFNSMTITNATLLSSTGTIGGSTGSASNTVTVLAGGTWNLLGNGLEIGKSSTGNTLVVNGGLVTNVNGQVAIGDSSTTGIGNSITISNGGQFYGGQIVLGANNSGDSNNSYNVGGFGAASFASNGLISLSSGGFSTLTVTNATLQSNGGNIGLGSVGNVVNVRAGGTWNLLGGNLFLNDLGTGNSGNVVVVNAGIVTNVGTVGLGLYQGNAGLTISNGGQLYAGNVTVGWGGANGGSTNFYNVGGFGTVSTVSNGAITVGAAGSSANTMTVTNATLVNSGNVTIGSGATNNVVTVASNATWNVLGNNLTVGTGQATGNVLTLNAGSIVTNVGTLNVAGNATGSGTLTLNAGAQLFVQTLLVTNNIAGGATNSFFNFNGGTLTTSNASGQVAFNFVAQTNGNFAINGNWNMLGGSASIAQSAAGSGGGATIGNGVNVLATGTGTAWTVAGALSFANNNSTVIVSNGAFAAILSTIQFSGATNSFIVTGPGSVVTNGLGFNLFQNGIANNLTIANGGKFVDNLYYVGNSASANSNTVLVTGTGSVWSNLTGGAQTACLIVGQQPDRQQWRLRVRRSAIG